MLDLDGAALLKAVIDDPADDLPRLAYADWCEENGDTARAGLIRLQVRAEADDCILASWPWSVNWPPPPFRDLRMVSHQAKGHAVVSEFGDGSGGPRMHSLAYRRGFVRTVRLPLTQWEIYGKELVRAHPLERVELSDRDPENWQEGTDFAWYRYDRLDPGGPWIMGRDPDDLPPELWDLLDLPLDPMMVRYEPNRHKVAATAEAAHDALSAACLRWARCPDA